MSILTRSLIPNFIQQLDGQQVFQPYNLLHFEILPGTGERGIFGPDPENRVTVNGSI